MEAPRYNHPCEDLLDSGRREEYINICVPLYRASIRGDLEAARVILEGREHLVRYSITEQKETPLHVAAAVHNPKFLKYLVDMMSMDDLTLQNEEGNNAFCLAAIVGNRKMAMIMLQKNRQLLTIRGSGNRMPLYLATLHKQYDAMIYLYEHSQRMTTDGWTDDDRNRVFMECIEIDYFDVALRMLNDRKELPQDMYSWNVLWLLAQKAHVFYERPATLLIGLYMISTALSRKKKVATELLRRIWKRIVVKNRDEIDEILKGPVVKIAGKDTYPSRILFLAAENGNIKFLVELIREYPDLIWKTNDDGQTIFHVGVIHRHERIRNLLYELRAMKDKITQLTDKDGNTLLHSVSMNTGRNPNEHVRGAAFHLQNKLVWFKKIQAMFPPSYMKQKNAAGQTPREVFTHNHKEMLPEGEKWMKDISNQCMVVAALITTISFSAAFTIPGGYNQTSGFPIFQLNTPFMVFVILDAISFILSSVSILIYLSISFSRYSEKDFLYSITTKFIYGLTALTFSIVTLMAAFSASFFVLYHSMLPIIMSSFATLPIIIFGLLESSLFEDMAKTHIYHCPPKTRMLFY